VNNYIYIILIIIIIIIIINSFSIANEYTELSRNTSFKINAPFFVCNYLQRSDVFLSVLCKKSREKTV
jgi:hypothetical protein